MVGFWLQFKEELKEIKYTEACWKEQTAHWYQTVCWLPEDHLKPPSSLLYSCSHLYAGRETRARWRRCITHWLIRCPQPAAVWRFGRCAPAGGLAGRGWPRLCFRGHYLDPVLALSSASHLLALHPDHQDALARFTQRSTSLRGISCVSLSRPVHTQQPSHTYKYIYSWVLYTFAVLILFMLLYTSTSLCIREKYLTFYIYLADWVTGSFRKYAALL